MSSTIDVLGYALSALSAQRQVLAGNIANDQTPGYVSRTYSFESSLRAALGSSAPSTVTPAAGLSAAPAGPNGNNVDLTQELSKLSSNDLQAQAVVNALNIQFRILRGSMGGGFQ
jgi:flagellar basal-body rod protein FlgB